MVLNGSVPFMVLKPENDVGYVTEHGAMPQQYFRGSCMNITETRRDLKKTIRYESVGKLC